MPEPMEFGCNKCENLRKKAEDRLKLIQDLESNMEGANQFRDGQISVFTWVLRELR